MTTDPLPPPAPQPWLLRIPAIFDALSTDVLSALGAAGSTRLGQEYHLVRACTAQQISSADASIFVRWNLPMDHTWPCNPQKMDGFIEKAAQTLRTKFSAREPQGLFIGPLNPGSPDKYWRSLASNLRGRALQVFGTLPCGDVDSLEPDKPALYALVGKEGLFCGMQSPRDANGFHPGGSKFIAQSEDTISRAGAKIAEALHYLRLHQPALPEGAHWLELGACPGGMTSELLARGYQVTAVDCAPLDRRLYGRAGLHFTLGDVASWSPPPEARFDALLSDLNGPPLESLGHVRRLSRTLRPGGIVVFTLKLPELTTVENACVTISEAITAAAGAGLRLVARTHLTYNRQEFTLFFQKNAGSTSSH